MQTEKLPLWAKVAGYLFGKGLVFIGVRFMLAPEVAERGFGLIYDQPGYAFHYIKGVRDLFTGLVITGFTIANWRKPLAVIILVGSVIPIVDMLVVLNAPAAVPGTEWIHGLTAFFAWIFGFFLLAKQTVKRHAVTA